MSERTIERFAVLCAMLIIMASLSFGQSPDRHLNADPAKALFARSGYAHGYAHGYEDGFHNGDMDIHMGRGERELKDIKEYKNPDDGYRPHFGDQKYFRSGYMQGFREGYFDAVRGERFRAEQLLIAASQGIASEPLDGFTEKDFDAAFSNGYQRGRAAGQHYPLFDTSYNYAESICRSRIPAGKAQYERNYCDAFTRGFNLGFSDGQGEGIASVTETASR